MTLAAHMRLGNVGRGEPPACCREHVCGQRCDEGCYHELNHAHAARWQAELDALAAHMRLGNVGRTAVCRTCGETLKRGYYHKHNVDDGERLSCDECGESFNVGESGSETHCWRHA